MLEETTNKVNTPIRDN